MKFVVYLNESFLNTSIDELDLSIRSQHCLMRAGLFTIGDVIRDIDKQEDLLKYRNLGVNSAKEIMRKIFLYHYEHLKDNQKSAYLKRIVELNE